MDPERLGQVDRLLHEQVGPSHHGTEPDRELEQDQAPPWFGGRAAGEDQRTNRFGQLHLAATQQSPPYVDAVGGHEDNREGYPELRRRAQSEHRRQREEAKEESEVSIELRGVRGQVEPLGSATAVAQGR